MFSTSPKLPIYKNRRESKTLKMILRLSLIVALWLAWKRTASLPLCLAFWIIVLIWAVRPIASRRPSAAWVLVLIGVLSNAVVTLANSGVMPANYDVATFIPASPIWQPAADRHLLLLSDQRALSYFSIGDLCLLTGSVLALIWNLILQTHSPNPKAQEKK